VIDRGKEIDVAFASVIEDPNARLMTLKRASSAALADCSCTVAPQTLSVVVEAQSETVIVGPGFPGVYVALVIGLEQDDPEEKNGVTVASAVGIPTTAERTAPKKTLRFMILSPVFPQPS